MNLDSLHELYVNSGRELDRISTRAQALEARARDAGLRVRQAQVLHKVGMVLLGAGLLLAGAWSAPGLLVGVLGLGLTGWGATGVSRDRNLAERAEEDMTALLRRIPALRTHHLYLGAMLDDRFPAAA